MLQAVAVLITAGLVVGGLVGTDVIGGEEGGAETVAAPVAGEGAAPADEAEEQPAESDAQQPEGAEGGQAEGAGGGQPGGAGGGQPEGSAGGDDGGAAQAAQNREASTRTFCIASQRLDRAGRRIFDDLGQQPNPPQRQLRSASRRFATQNRQLLDRAERSAPAAIKQDVTTLVQAARARGGLGGQAPDRREASAAEQRVTRFERARC